MGSEPEQRLKSRHRRAATIVAKDEFSQVGLQVLWINAMVCSCKPRLKIREHAVDMRQPLCRHFPGSLNTRDMSVVAFRQCLITLQPIGLDGSAVLHIRLNEGRQSLACKVWNELQADASSRFTAVLYSPHDERFTAGAATSLSWLRSPDVGLIDLDGAPQCLTMRRDHCSSQFMEHGPSCFVALHSQLSLELKRRYSWRMGRDKVRRPEPVSQGSAGPVQNCPSGHGSLETTLLALHQVPSGQIERFGVSALSTAVTLWPAAGRQVRPAG